jgi:PAS domain S-box-containing protein
LLQQNSQNVKDLANILSEISFELHKKNCKELESSLEKIKTFLQDELIRQTDGLKDSILERQKIEEQLNLFYQGTEQSAASIVMTNIAGDIIYVNRKFTEVTGYSFEEAIGQNPRILKSGDQPLSFYEDLWDTITSGKNWSGQFHNKRKDGTLYWEDARIFPIFNSAKEMTHFVAIKEDITKRKEAEERNEHLLQSQLVINNLLNSVANNDKVDDLYSLALENILSLKWLGTQSCAAFITYKNNKFSICKEINLNGNFRKLIETVIEKDSFANLINISDVEFFEGGKSFLDKKIDCAFYFIPLKNKEQIFGAIFLLLDSKYQPNKEHLDFLKYFANTATLVLAKKQSDIKLNESLLELRETSALLKVEAKQKEKLILDLVNSEKKYREIFESFVDVYYRVDINGIIEIISPSVKEVSGYSVEELIGKPSDIFYANPDDRQKFHEDIVKSGYLKNYEVEMLHKDGTIAVASFNSKLIFEDGKPVAVQGTFRDISDLKNVEEELRKAKEQLEEEVQTKDKFFSIISHDLRSPFTALLGYSRMLVEDYDSFSEEEVKEAIRALNQTSENIFYLLDGLLTWSRAQRGKLEFNPAMINLNEVVNNLFELLFPVADQKGVTLLSEVIPNTMVFADYDLLQGILRNLISNAIKFTGDGGTITVKHKPLPDADAISIVDTGVGMTEKDVDKLFRIDVHHSTPGTNNEPGTGLGLVLVKELVEKHGGKISVSSVLGKGSIFEFTLPKEKK